MEASGVCVECGEPVEGTQGIPCYLCGRSFHYSDDRECGLVLPNLSAC